MYEPRQETIAVRIKKALKIKGMRQAELCKLANIPKSSLSQYLNGDFEPKQDRIYLIAQALNVSEAWLMGFNVPMERQVKKVSPSEPSLTEGEQLWLELYHQISDDTRDILIKMMISFDRLPEDRQKFALEVIRAALGGH